MSLPHALLTALAERPGSGSELADRFDRSIGYFWQATHQQIYRELGRLEETGWIESLPAESGRGRKRAYRILPAGKKELRRWIAEQEDPTPLREALMVRLRAEAVLGPAGLEDEIRRRIALHQEKLDLYLQIEARDFSEDGDSRMKRLQHLVLQAGIANERFWVEFSQHALDVLRLPKD
ncbi:PadR family transcriptional regulator [Burkholderia contaminans]|uniref:PadR family transcriptional regulator n=1 Tax=Burkholderia contaminans TaxID=488447 RepID=UPI0014545F1D|nr:PadR family transcriptional regulator [Burkholderia contaminans]MEB4630888.1 PadR family transcriptional regulator [Burkholderia contaminans]MEB4639257.1 PadR family transcriptional regulator [Burkholderia contaminans]MEB4653913.1 PadR family transcriptional regulator [Burkholderia contaminans]MEB4658384.1 PadR family transcriptional regulator [Burkholderia contaminans]MEB4659408.1 PadR family transcriptional regulator [Burkholderia contaminans]